MTSRILITLAFILSVIAAGAQSQSRTFITGTFKEAIIPAPKVESNFKRSYPDVKDEKWSTQNGYYFVSFKKGNIKNQVVYTQSGHLDYALKMYGETTLPTSIRSIIKSVYYDYRITNVQELELDNKTIYLVKVADSKTFKTVRVCDGEMEEIESYSTVISPCR